MKTPLAPKQRAPVSRFVPKLNQHVGVLWLWGTQLKKRATDPANEPLLEVFATPDVAQTLRDMRGATHGPRRFATHVAFEPFDSIEEAQAYAEEAVKLFEPEHQARASSPPQDTGTVL